MSFEVTGAQDLWLFFLYEPHTPATEINYKLMMYDLKLQVPAAFLYWHLLGRQEEINSSNTKTSNSCFKTRACMQTTITRLWFLSCIIKKDTWFTFTIPWTLCYSHLCSPSTWPPFSTWSLHFLFMQSFHNPASVCSPFSEPFWLIIYYSGIKRDQHHIQSLFYIKLGCYNSPQGRKKDNLQAGCS